MNNLDWALLRSFLAVVEHGSLSSAASRTNLTQPTLSRHIRELEAALGIKLFTRAARGLDLTDAALALVDDARSMGIAANAIRLKASGHSHKLEGTVRITASVVVANLLLPPFIAALRLAEPHIQIEIAASDATQDILRGDADIAIRMFDPTQKMLIAHRLGQAEIGLFATRSYLARRGRPTCIADLLAHDIIGFDRSNLMMEAFSAQGLAISRNDFPLRCDDQMVCWNLLLTGGGLGFAQVLLAEQQPHLERLDIGFNIPALPVWLVMHEELRANPRIRRVADFLRQELKQFLATSRGAGSD